MGAREDRGGRLALQLLERDQRVVPAAEPWRALLDERPHERAVLVERRPAGVLVLDERDRQLGAVVELAQEVGEGAEHEAAERGWSCGARRATPPSTRSRADLLSSPRGRAALAAGTPVRGAVVVALATGPDRRAAAPARPAGTPVHGA